MLAQAIDKLRSEMTQNIANSYIQVVGGFLLQHLESSPQDAEKILDTDKTISKSLDEMWKVAEKNQHKNFAMFTPQEGLEIVMKYFGIETAVNMQMPTAPAPAAKPKSEIDFDIKLEDLL